MLAADWDTTVAMARDQVKEGAHVLDVCVDYTGADGVADMTEVASRFATQASVPLMVDSTEAPVVEAALKWIGGRPILNSVNLEEGDDPGTRLDKFLTLAREYGAAVVCTCIDTEGQARTADWKVRAATAIHDIAVDRYGLEPSDLIFDPLVLPAVDGHGGEPPRRHRDHRGHPAHQGRAARGVHHRRAVQRVVRPQPRGPPRPQLDVPPRAASRPASTRPSSTRPASSRCPRSTSGPARSASTSSTTAAREGYDPLQELLAIFEGVSATAAVDRGPHGLDRRAPPRAAHHRRRPQRARGRPRRGACGRATRRSPSSTTSSWPA